MHASPYAPTQLLSLLGLDTHFHKCAKAGCGMIWSHSRADAKSQAEHDAAHQCPKCDTTQREKCEPDGSEYRAAVKLTEREIATILAALRNRQEVLDDEGRDSYADIATQKGRIRALDANEIEHLGDRLHAGE